MNLKSKQKLYYQIFSVEEKIQQAHVPLKSTETEV